MREVDIRHNLYERIRREHRTEPDTVIVEELGLCKGIARVDMAAVNGNLHGYEIKSARDSFGRLPLQTAVYSQALDFVTLVVAPNHSAKAAQAIPEWWGILRVEERRGKVVFTVVRQPQRNPKVNAEAVAQLLWRDEVLDELERLNAADGVRSKPRGVLWHRLATVLAPEQVGAVVRHRLTIRQRWRRDSASRA
jgi:hypothetical protein